MMEDRLFNKAYDYIKDKIDSNCWPPGTKITEQLISEALFMSRTPIRTALLLLEEEGLVKSIPYKGYIVAEKKISNEGLLERLELIAGLVMNYLQYLKENDIALDYEEFEKILERQVEYLSYRDATGYFTNEYRLFEMFIAESDNQFLKKVILTTARDIHGTYSDNSDLMDEERYQSEAQLLALYQEVSLCIRDKDYDKMGEYILFFFETLKDSNDSLAQ
ncbi:GntR family transcriptional regulator [Trichococcus pasteurii]|uniref:Transcription regulator hth gntr n=2 Tax=root TaxID=1 RepID=A0A1W1IHH0_9LACT|nr:GntR family transcriptional regulator [Trichococcus pasteurii]SFE51546.1 DNA-binding transcriptional regulator, GntR family [Trichococcus pasteurii]SLM52465.1 transcription regulator hth gntr [Trichococcus pasteurii]SSB93346.1 transcription regulator hth gntr [Trichococcus pasteurii]